METIIIELKMNEILYDVQNKTYLTGKSRKDGSNHERVANMQANDDEENANQLLRSVAMAFSKLKMRLGEYLDQTATSANNTLLDPSDDITLGLTMPSNYNRATVGVLANAAHQYIVSLAVAEWFTITNKSDAKDYAVLAEESLALITEAASKRVRPRHPNEPKEGQAS